MAEARYLISGAKSGLGRHLVEHFGAAATPITRETDLDALATDAAQATIIHCAFNSGRPASPADTCRYIEDNLLLTERLLRLPHNRFVFVSTVDVYPRDDGPRREDREIGLDALQGGYPVTKFLSEILVRERGRAPLVLRPTAMLGRYARPNSLVRLLTDPTCRLTLSPDSRFNYIRHEDVAGFVDLALAHGLDGVYNLAARSNVRLGDVAAAHGRSPQFGSFVYDVGEIDAAKVRAVCPAFDRTSEDFVTLFTSEMT